MQNEKETSRNGYTWGDAEKEKLRKMINGGMRVEKIALTLKRSCTAVGHKIWELKLAERKKKGRERKERTIRSYESRYTMQSAGCDIPLRLESDLIVSARNKLGENLRYNQKHNCYELRTRRGWAAVKVHEMVKAAGMELSERGVM